MSEPTTPTGKRLAKSLAYEAREAGAPDGYDDWTASILAIEHEAAAAERERLLAKGEAMYSRLPADYQPAHALFLLALLDDDDPKEAERE